ncbi:MAG: diadenylate cyclase CdaA [Bacteroidales bacterium]|nr:diadenylate cyclase CdaA [Bacteroidales bacterium]MDD3010156.1 diadenylate cyclase CdaA [Bacteroidales bacterium]MDY0285643.1 diadenylate cyclase CdaA [Bacteroidales bacterium]HPE87030.1 diadenylate cyclase CdaA [Bacteroidales bacterium]
MNAVTLAILGLRFLDVIDILLVAVMLYALYNFLRGTAAINIFFGIVAIFLLWKVVDALNMKLLREILGAFVSVGFIALLVVFQPEIRKFLLMLGTPSFIHNKKNGKFLFWRMNFSTTEMSTIDTLVESCRLLSQEKIGALMIITRKNGLRQYLITGETINADLTTPLIHSIFFKNSPLHDGAVIISGNKIQGARCILPVSENNSIPSGLGLRHRAAAGVTEVSDALAIIVSEEKGTLSLCENGIIDYNLDAAQLKQRLIVLLEVQEI